MSSTIFGLDRLAAVTSETRWTELATGARTWFDARDVTGTPIYDRARGRVADGVDDGRVSRNSGAEANEERTRFLSAIRFLLPLPVLTGRGLG